MLASSCLLVAGFVPPLRMQEPAYVRAMTLRQELAAAVSAESFAKAALLRDEIAALKHDTEVQVQIANAEFYEALRAHDEKAMQRIWADGPLSSFCTRPYDGFPQLHSREAILQCWLEVSSDKLIHVSDARCVVLRGGQSAVVQCVERRLGKGPGDGAIAATNIFELDEESDTWRLVLHQSMPVSDNSNSSDEDAVDYDADDFPGATG